MPHVYYGLLVQLSEAPRPAAADDRAGMSAKITRSRLSHAVARLEKNGWVRREDCPSDKRGQFAVLTERARGAAADRARPCGRRTPGAVRPAHAGTAASPSARSCEIIAEGLQPKEAGADLPWLR